ncbi:ComEC/Rec2 family competence protein [Mariprofundus ferrooxydans]|uniref:ComEC/Rec2 family competence protein n=1 Tax=Mariprofundus ferrooxydans TaxID=314344 RepID=UPI00036289CB|nr:MBL fold metallo-hydrolase [Mariprofundus ferrooxydans]
MNLPSCYVVDVGHGNASVLVDTDGVLIIDAGPRQKLLQFLLSNNILHISAILISHSDRDHIAGIIDLVLEEKISIDAIYVNPDPSQDSKTWDDAITAIENASKEIAVGSAHSGLTGTLDNGSVNVEVLVPTVADSLRGIKGEYKAGTSITKHSLNVVVSMNVGDKRLVLLPGDMDDDGLASLIGLGKNMSSEVLVFPHHGGKPGRGNIKKYLEAICNTVAPTSVVFSVGHNSDKHPRTDVIEHLNTNLPETQLWATGEAQALANLIESGLGGKCYNCAGTICIEMGGTTTLSSLSKTLN